MVLGVFGGTLAYFLGGWDTMLKILVLCVVLDYITGVLCAVVAKNLSSEIGYKGIVKKCMIFMVVALSASINFIIDGSPVRDVVIAFFIANEGISILENTSQYIPIPEKLKVLLIQLRDKEG